MVTTSLKMPAIERVTTLVRWRRANSEAVMQNAIIPGKRRRAGPSKGPFSSIRRRMPSKRSGNVSTGTAMMNRETNIMGAR